MQGKELFYATLLHIPQKRFLQKTGYFTIVELLVFAWAWGDDYATIKRKEED